MKDEDEKTGIARKNRVFVNRTLNFANIDLIGFDMDHTLAPYKRETFEDLAFKATLNKFIEAGYPEELSQLEFKNDFVIRGLIVDQKRGNVLKVDGHKYVKCAYHGHIKLSKEQRDSLYNQRSFKAQDFLSIDTFFALSEVQLFVEIIDYMNKNPGKISKGYIEVYADLREFIDQSHRDGTIKNEVVRHPDRYIKQDKHLATALIRLIDADKKLFLLTNSQYEYTKDIMRFVLDGASGELPSWKDYWEYIIVGAGKPGFFTGSQTFFEVIESSGLLKIHEGPLVPSKVYCGGNAKTFEKVTKHLGDAILYVGDHIYGDIIQSKGSVNWRTMLIIDELDQEIQSLESLQSYSEEINEKLDDREILDEKLQKIRSLIAATKRQLRRAKDHQEKNTTHISSSLEKLEQRLTSEKERLKSLETEIKKLIDDRAAKFHPMWGELMKVGLERSRFANQVNNYACTYTSQVANLRFYSPFKKFISHHERLPHDE